MSRKDYRAITAVFASYAESHPEAPAAVRAERQFMRSVLARGIAHVLQQDNPRFSLSTFLAACRVPE